mmetsp:Transcript_21588/g.50332  ORF Transcript_21588/g.50332 Transcript_21588/m.50332 type:complete len:387 (+) Transcript_21588:598-1758(+)
MWNGTPAAFWRDGPVCTIGAAHKVERGFPRFLRLHGRGQDVGDGGRALVDLEHAPSDPSHSHAHHDVETLYRHKDGLPAHRDKLAVQRPPEALLGDCQLWRVMQMEAVRGSAAWLRFTGEATNVGVVLFRQIRAHCRHAGCQRPQTGLINKRLHISHDVGVHARVEQLRAHLVQNHPSVDASIAREAHALCECVCGGPAPGLLLAHLVEALCAPSASMRKRVQLLCCAHDDARANGRELISVPNPTGEPILVAADAVQVTHEGCTQELAEREEDVRGVVRPHLLQGQPEEHLGSKTVHLFALHLEGVVAIPIHGARWAGLRRHLLRNCQLKRCSLVRLGRHLQQGPPCGWGFALGSLRGRLRPARQEQRQRQREGTARSLHYQPTL